MYEREQFQLPGQATRAIMFYTDDELKRAYKLIMMDKDSAGVFEPVAYGIRSLWHSRGRKKRVLNRIEKNFKNLRR